MRAVFVVVGVVTLAACSAPPERRPLPRTLPPAPAVTPPPRVTPEQKVQGALAFDLEPLSIEDVDPIRLWATYYYVPMVAHTANGFPLRDMAGEALGAELTRRDWCEAAMQGTVLVDGGEGRRTTYNYAGTQDEIEVDCKPVYPRHPAIGRTRFTVATGPYGDGVMDLVLVPFRTIAVDPKMIPFGSLVYIPAARGTELVLPDGTTAVHDGYFFAADRGGAIKQTHIDVFVGMGKRNPFGFVKSKSTATFDAYVLSEAAAPEAHARLSAGHEAYRAR